MKKTKNSLKKLYIALIFIFLYAPIAVLFVLSVNDSRSRAVWGGFTLKWYRELFADATIMTALKNTLIIAFVAAFFATVLGLLAAIGISAMKKNKAAVYLGAGNIPLINADIVTGITLMLFFSRFSSLGMMSILLSHITFCIPYVLLSVLPALSGIDWHLYEAARDLGATRSMAYRKVIWPELFPSVMGGFFIALTMSMDDFVVTYFTRGAGVDTLSTMIYGELKRGIKPQMFALSSVIFAVVLILLLLVYLLPSDGKIGRPRITEGLSDAVRSVVPFILVVSVVTTLTGCGSIQNPRYGADPEEEATVSDAGSNTITVLNYGEYLDRDLLEDFYDKTGIRVLYDEATTPEEMYTKYKSGAISYDLICTSEYIIKKLMDENELLQIDTGSMENYGNLDPAILAMAQTYDPDNNYSIPYFYGTVGLLYDSSKITGEVDSWDVLFDGSYSGEIIMQNSIRDAYMCALKYLGYSLNDTDREHMLEAQRLLLKQKPDVEAYFVDEVREEMVAGNATIAVCYSGEAYLANEYNEDLTYVVPKEGSNLWIDSWCMTKRCQNPESATAFLDYLCGEEAGMVNFEYVYYPTPNLAVYNALDEEIREDELVFPPQEVLKNCEVYETLPDDVMELYSEMWKELKVY